MSSDEAKLEKKRLKAQLKAEKARAKSGLPPETPAEPVKSELLPWYKDPNWIRAIIAIVSLMLMIITLLVTLDL